MKLSEYKETSKKYTEKASEITRQLTLAGIAIIWLFKNTGINQPILGKFLIFPLLFLSLGLIFDLLQYVVGGLTWICFFRKNEKVAASNDVDIKAPEYLNKPIYFFYYAKIVCMIGAYIFLIAFISAKL
ncbi:hypothetical protein AB6805_08275 [Chitinophaga sp. RCC_12]|uniref:hypothetical protein n=1 Tax=Chitinophaga sp. RCC_12 TaxID=3239226 RepID=UPI00352442FA